MDWIRFKSRGGTWIYIRKQRVDALVKLSDGNTIMAGGKEYQVGPGSEVEECDSPLPGGG